jgi:hypothetical protein
MKTLSAGLIVAVSFSLIAAPPRPAGALKAWQQITLSFQGPATGEAAQPNPFTDYRLTVKFTHAASGTAVVAPGYYAADGNAAESSAGEGNVWRVHLLAPGAGVWRWEASFRTGPGVALSEDAQAGTPVAGVDGLKGEFRVAAADPKAPGFLAKGLLSYDGSHFFRFANGERFLKGGADSPENFLAYADFDGTFDTDAAFNEGRNTTGKAFVHQYAPHLRDWRAGDPVWQKTKGKGIIGALNYLAGKGMNSVYFLTYNIDTGDGKDVWPWTVPEVRDRFDVSKLAQWEIVFSHMDRLGIQLHVVTQETENDHKLGGGPGLNPARRLYLRELIARFSHHHALIWNLGEENNTPDADRKLIASYIRSLDPYRHPITVHTHVNRIQECYGKLLGHEAFEATSIQADMDRYHRYTLEMREASAKAGRKWAIFGDEQTHADSGIVPDADDPGHDVPRKRALWGNLMAGGSGVEWYFGYKYPHMDLNCEDWRSRDRMWDQTRFALEFFHRYLPFWEMAPGDGLASGGAAFVLAKPGQVYAVYLPQGGSIKLKLETGSYAVDWYNPRSGGPLLKGGQVRAEAGTETDLGPPPTGPAADWAALLRRVR